MKDKKQEPTVEIQYVYRSTSAQLTREAFLATLTFLYQPHTQAEIKCLDRFSLAMCDLWSDLHDNEQQFRSYTNWLKLTGRKVPHNIEEMGALAQQIEDHLEAAQGLGMNPCD
jgi:hypothetical protein